MLPSCWRSQQLAKAAWDAGYFDAKVFEVQAPVLGEDDKPTGDTRTVSRDQGLRETTLEGLGQLKTIGEDRSHTADNAWTVDSVHDKIADHFADLQPVVDGFSVPAQ